MSRSTFKPIRSHEDGFTLVELLVVILIIGILAAIAIPAFVGQRAKAQDADAKAAVRNAASAAEAFYIEGQTYLGLNRAALEAIEPSLKNVTWHWCDAGYAKDTYCLSVLSKTGTGFAIVKDASQPKVWGWPSTLTRTCTEPGKGGCSAPKAGQFGGWGGVW